MIPSSSHVVSDDAAASTRATKASVSAANNTTGVNTLSVSELRAGMEQFLRTSGALGLLKTQLRSVIVSELLKRQGPSLKAAAPQIGSGDINRDDENAIDDKDNAWTRRLADALVENHLRITGRSFSLAIFGSEADVTFGSVRDSALAELLHFNGPVELLLVAQKKASLLQSVVEAHLRTVGDERGRRPGYAVGTQTDACDNDLTPPSLELRLAAVDAKYALCFARLGESTREEVDRRMSAYRQELQMQMEREYQQRLRAFEQQRLLEARREAEDHYTLLLRQKMEELHEVQQTSTQRVVAERARLTQARDDVELQRAELERRHRELQGLLEERDKTTALMEGRLNDAKQQIRVLMAQVQQLEDVCSVRLSEAEGARDREWRRVEDIRRLQAEHAAELQLKDEEIGRLRFRIKSILAAHGVAGGLEELKMESTATAIQEAITRANALQRGVAAVQNWPQGQQLRETALQFASQPATLSHLTTKAAVDRRGEPEERPVMTRSIASVMESGEDAKKKSDEVAQFVTNSSAVAAAASSFYQTEVVSALVQKTSLPTLEQPQQLKGVEFVENEEKKVFEEVERVDDIKDSCSNSSGSSKTEKSEKRETFSVDSSALSVPKSEPRRPDWSVNGKDNTNQSSSSSLSTRSSECSPVFVDEKAVCGNTIIMEQVVPPPAVEASVLRENQNILCRKEADERANVETEESSARQAIEWTAKSQYNVLLQRQAAAREQNKTDFLPASLWDGRIAQARQQQQAVQTITITPESDDDADNDILFGRRGSSDESF